jgi:beta,beta-carotene 9',10'-dioxygenase
MGHISFTNLEIENFKLHIKSNRPFPEWLNGGTYYRNGPALFEKNGISLSHWIDGLAMIHKFDFVDNKLFYTNRLLRTSHYESIFEKKEYPYPLFGSDYHQKFNVITNTIIDKLLFRSHKIIPNANVGISFINNELVALGDYPKQIVIDPQSLNIKGLLNFSDSLPTERCMEPGHPHFDHYTKSIYGLIIQYSINCKYIFYVLKPNSTERKKLSVIETKYPSYVHSFSITENFIILFEYPFLLDIPKFLFSKKSFINNFKWYENEKTKVTIIDKFTGKVVKRHMIPSCFSFHHVNAFEENNTINVDLAMYKNSSIISNNNQFTKKNSHFDFSNMSSRLTRFYLPINKSITDSIILLDENADMPRINYLKNGKCYRYIYSIDLLPPDFNKSFSAIYKTDLMLNKTSKWGEIECYPSETIFVAKPNSIAEDDGILISIITNVKEKYSFLIILDAQSLSEISRFNLTHHIPQGLHGNFFRIID